MRHIFQENTRVTVLGNGGGNGTIRWAWVFGMATLTLDVIFPCHVGGWVRGVGTALIGSHPSGRDDHPPLAAGRHLRALVAWCGILTALQFGTAWNRGRDSDEQKHEAPIVGETFLPWMWRSGKNERISGRPLRSKLRAPSPKDWENVII